ncbi:MAG: hypothetical protein IIY95_03920, partial [Firmicutes bacterium]|nr:hypothetical protein [Bacillota bacterium]
MAQEKFSFSEVLRARSAQPVQPAAPAPQAPAPVPPAPPADVPTFSRFEQPTAPPAPKPQDSWSDYIDYRGPRNRRAVQEEDLFPQLCAKVMEVFFQDWEDRDSSRSALEIQKRAIIGYEKEKSFFKNRIADIV